METFTKYKRTQIAEMRPVTQNDIDLYKSGDSIPASFQFNISISDADTKNGSPKIGDMIARNPKNHLDQWLVAKQYFDENFEVIIPPEVEYAQKYIADCTKDMGFMGSPEYYKQKKIVDDYFEPIRQKQQEDKEREDYLRLKSKFETT